MTRVNTKRMFLERVSPEDRDKYKPKYSIQEYDVVREGVTYLSMYSIYMKSVDEYDFAIEHLGGMPAWGNLLDTKWFVEGYRSHRGIEAWREDLRARDESTAKKILMLAASDGDVSAAKKLLDISKKVAIKYTRLKKEQTIKEVAKNIEDKEFLDNAALRLNVVSIRD